jgi:hypothetical protein
MSSNEPSPIAATQKSEPASGFARTGRLVARRTTDLLAIAIIAIGGLMIGGRLSEWWSTDPDDIPSPAEIARHEGGTPGDWDVNATPVTLEFGDSHQTLRRQTLQGTEAEVFKSLAGWCRETLHSGVAPGQPPADVERRFLKQLATVSPLEDKAGNRIYRLTRPMRMVVGVRGATEGVVPEKAGSKKPDAAPPPARVVCWGFAFPVQEGTWTLFLASPAGAGPPGSSFPEVPLPAESQRHLSLRNDAGDGVVGFSGTAEPEDWRRGFDGWFKSHGWAPARAWSELNGSWSARFATPADDAETSWQGTVDVQISRDQEGRLSGLLSFVPSRRGAQ